MKKTLSSLTRLFWSISILLVSSSALAADCSGDIKAVTAKDANLAVEILTHRVKPLTKCELEVEAQAWLVLLKEKIEDISNADIAVIYKKEEIKKIALLKHITDLRTERTMLIDRFNTVLDELKEKGGATDEYDYYINAVSGIEVDLTDASIIWTTLSGWLLSEEGGFRWALNFIKFIVIIFVFYLLSIVAAKATRKALSGSEKFSSLLREFLVMSSRRLVIIIGLFVGLSALEVNLGPVLAMVGAAGFVIAFALQNSLSNFASGILMLMYRPFDIGNFIDVAGVQGTVESMNLMSTQLRKPDNQLVIVPNNSVWAGVITNITGITERRIDMVFGIGYGDDSDKAQKILEQIISDNALVLKQPEAIVKLHELADSSVNFVCRPWIKPANYWEVYWDITREVKLRFDKEGISIPFPQQDIHIYHEEKK